MILLTACEMALGQTLPVYRWAGSIAGTGNEYAEYLKCDSAGNIVVSGRFDGTCDFDPGTGNINRSAAGSTDCYLAKYDKNGLPLWVITFGGTGADRINAHTIDNAGNIYVTGYYAGTVDFDPGAGTNSITAAAGSDMFISKFTASGNYEWTRSYGSNATDYAWNVACDLSGNVFMVGEFNSDSITFDPLNGASTLVNFDPALTTYDGFVVKLDSAGQYLWGRTTAGPGSDYLRAVNVTGSGDVIVSGYFNAAINLDPGNPITAFGLADGFMARFQSNGTFTWISRVGGTGTDNILSTAISGNDIVITGIFNGLADLDPGAGTVSLASNGLADIFIAKYDANTGGVKWALGFGKNNSEAAGAIDVNANGDIYLTGSFLDSTQLDPSGTQPTLEAYGGRDGFLAKFDASGGFIFGVKLGSSSTDFGRALAVDPISSEIWTSGNYNANIFFPDPNNPAISLPNSGLNDAYLGRYGNCAFPIITTQPSNAGACPGGNASFSVSGTGSNLTYQWQIGLNGGTLWSNLLDTGIFSGATTPTLALTAATTNYQSSFYRCILAADCGFTKTSAVGIMFVGSPNTSVNQNQHILTAQQGGNATYQWVDCNNGNAPISGATVQQFIPSQPGSYAVQITLNGCAATSTCYAVTVIGQQELTADGSRVFPIPAQESLIVQMTYTGRYEVNVYDLSGKKMLPSAGAFDQEIRLDVSMLEKGSYLLGVRDAAGIEKFSRIILQ